MSSVIEHLSCSGHTLVASMPDLLKISGGKWSFPDSILALAVCAPSRLIQALPPLSSHSEYSHALLVVLLGEMEIRYS